MEQQDKPKSGLLAKIGGKISEGLSTADKTVEEATERVRGALKADQVSYESRSFETVAVMAESLNAFNRNPEIKSCRVIGMVPNLQGGVDALLLFTR